MQIYGKMDRVGDPKEPHTIPQFTYAWEISVPLYQGEIEFFAIIWISITKVILSFNFGRIPCYHTPSFIRDNFKSEIVHSDPKFLLSRPDKPSFPIAIFVPPNPQLNIDGQVGQCYPYKDFEFLPSAGVGLIRGEFTEEMISSPSIFELYCGIGVQSIISHSNSFFLIMYTITALSFPRIFRKFEGMIKGVVFINPIFEAPEGSPFTSLDPNGFPQCDSLIIFGKRFTYFEKSFPFFFKNFQGYQGRN